MTFPVIDQDAWRARVAQEVGDASLDTRTLEGLEGVVDLATRFRRYAELQPGRGVPRPTLDDRLPLDSSALELAALQPPAGRGPGGLGLGEFLSGEGR